MPRDSNGIYTLPTGNPVLSGELIESTWANTTMSDIAQALTGSLPRDGSAPVTGALTLSAGNLIFGGASQRIQGDFSNAIPGNRVLFQSNVANGATNIGAMPNGAGTASAFNAFAGNDPSNAAYGSLLADGTAGVVVLAAAKTGTGGYLPLSFQTGGLERFRLSATANRFQADFSNATVANRLLFQTSTLNGVTSIGALPNGTATASAILAYGGTDPDNAANVQIWTDNTTANLVANKNGTGPLIPLCFGAGGAERFRLSATANLFQADFSNAGIANRLTFQSSVANGDTQLGICPNGTSRSSYFRAFNNTDIANASFLHFAAYQFDCVIEASKTGSGTYNPIEFYTSAAERMRLTATGELLLRTVSNSDGAVLCLNQDASVANVGISPFTSSTATRYHFYIRNGNGVVGNISSAGTGTTYATTSDYRLKKDIEDLKRAGEFIDALRPRSFVWRETGELAVGFIAHELQQVSPTSVSGEKDGMRDVLDPETREPTGRREIEPQGVFPGSPEMIAMMVAELQDLRRRVAELETTLNDPLGH
jgi:hypothetical protein